MPAQYIVAPTITYKSSDGPLNKALGFQAYGVSYSNLNDAWLQIGKYGYAAPNSSGTFSLDGDETAQATWAAPPGTTQGANTADKVAYLSFTAESLPNSGGPLALGMNNPMTTLGDMITALAGGVASRLPVGTANQVLTVVGGVPAWANPAIISSVQYGTVAMQDAVGLTSKTATITNVDTTRSVVIMLGQSSDSAINTNNRGNFPRLALTNGTTVTATVANGNGVGTLLTVAFVVVTFAAFVVANVQQGNINLSGVATQTATITSVNTAKSVLLQLGWTTTDNLWKDDVVRITLTNATTITATRIGISGAPITDFAVITFQ